MQPSCRSSMCHAFVHGAHSHRFSHYHFSLLVSFLSVYRSPVCDDLHAQSKVKAPLHNESLCCRLCCTSASMNGSASTSRNTSTHIFPFGSCCYKLQPWHLSRMLLSYANLGGVARGEELVDGAEGWFPVSWSHHLLPLPFDLMPHQQKPLPPIARDNPRQYYLCCLAVLPVLAIVAVRSGPHCCQVWALALREEFAGGASDCRMICQGLLGVPQATTTGAPRGRQCVSKGPRMTVGTQHTTACVVCKSLT
jgi:hypothetical protein